MHGASPWLRGLTEAAATCSSPRMWRRSLCKWGFPMDSTTSLDLLEDLVWISIPRRQKVPRVRLPSLGLAQGVQDYLGTAPVDPNLTFDPDRSAFFFHPGSIPGGPHPHRTALISPVSLSYPPADRLRKDPSLDTKGVQPFCASGQKNLHAGTWLQVLDMGAFPVNMPSPLRPQVNLLGCEAGLVRVLWSEALWLMTPSITPTSWVSHKMIINPSGMGSGMSSSRRLGRQ